MTRSQKRHLNRLLSAKRKTKNILSKIQELVEETGGIQYSIDKMKEYSDLALKAISHYPDTLIKTSLTNLVEYNGSRKK